MAGRSKKAPVVGAAVALVVLLVNTVVAHRNAQRLAEADREVARTYAVRATLERMLRALIDTETGQRGFLLTGDPRYLTPYAAALTRLGPIIDELKGLTAADPEHQARIATLEAKAARKLAELARTVDLRRDVGFEAARAVVVTDVGQNLMEEMRGVADEMSRAEDDRLQARQRDAAAALTTTLLANAVGAAAGLAMVGLAFYLVYRDRTAELARSNDRLVAEVAERTRAEERVRAAADELRRSNRELEEFAFVASHDLQEPLRKIQAFGERLRDRFRDALPDQGRDYLDRIQAAATRMSALISGLLTYSRVAARGEPFQAVDLGRVAGEVVADLEGRIQQTGGAVEIGPLPTIDGDPLQLRQLLQNLIGNALKFHRPDARPVVRVSARPAGGPGSCALTVEDNGVGFENEYRDKIFRFFQRLHPRDRFEGTGMGLAICRRIAERHGGTITASGRPGEGSSFVVTLPLTHTAEAATDVPIPAPDHDPDGR